MITRINSLNPRYIKAKGEDDQEIIMTEIIMIRVTIKIDIDQIVEIEGHHSEVEISTGRIIVEDHDMLIIIEMTLGETIIERHYYRGQHFRGGYRHNNNRNDNFGKGRSRDRQCAGNFSRNDRSSSSRSRSGSGTSTSRDRIRCFKCREYDHFAKDCPNSQTEKEMDQIQFMYNLDEEQTALKFLTTETYDNLIRRNSDDAIVDHLNL